ncbi:cytochrome b [Aerolutibacter ruishenii]|uniref:Cytochrome b561 n=1 Tax=Aerolutibacter ruishenii TaxID=686800 RepID=A0A562M0W3_9GAMM|nr:cytochrome b [Lysobacter ruishenii]TWI13587.1 cytochrome b561 [Lysobacter ruishenii]
MNALSRPRYTAGLRHLHWLVALLVLAAYLFIEQRGLFARGTPERAAMAQAHFWTGLTVLALAVWRVALRMRGTVPPITPALPAWQAVPSKLLHLALYAFILVMPLLGLATAWADDKTLYVPFTQVALPALLAPDKDLAHRLEDLHGTIGEAFYWVIGLHVLAALYHHLVRRDDTLRRML